jgi:hypothetical protein
MMWCNIEHKELSIMFICIFCCTHIVDALISGTPSKNVSLVQKLHKTSIERSFFAECPWTLRTTNYPCHQKQIWCMPTYNWQWCHVSMIYRWRIHVPPCLNNTLWSLSIHLTILVIFKFESCCFAPFPRTATLPWAAPLTLSPWCSQESWIT